MSEYVILMKLTDKGAVSPVPGEVLAQTLGAIDALEGRVDSADVTLGEWDFVVRCSGLNDDEIQRFAHWVAQQGLVRTTTLVAWPAKPVMAMLDTPDPRLRTITPRRYQH